MGQTYKSVKEKKEPFKFINPKKKTKLLPESTVDERRKRREQKEDIENYQGELPPINEPVSPDPIIDLLE